MDENCSAYYSTASLFPVPCSLFPVPYSLDTPGGRRRRRESGDRLILRYPGNFAEVLGRVFLPRRSPVSLKKGGL
ncbi:hypothetical protein [Moorena sp. SIO4A5]|uniref:hypothetical protein n=1 Tax=Moorena sp. SIO4A5 TaxID=2607838 RepID=UPI0013C76472|nr:hypothetical protein [Moorena sp. SIO4A5]NEO23157.1 hypothetical protein [Moorena sp. SIO4A5]